MLTDMKVTEHETTTTFSGIIYGEDDTKVAEYDGIIEDSKQVTINVFPIIPWCDQYLKPSNPIVLIDYAKSDVDSYLSKFEREVDIVQGAFKNTILRYRDYRLVWFGSTKDVLILSFQKEGIYGIRKTYDMHKLFYDGDNRYTIVDTVSIIMGNEKVDVAIEKLENVTI